MHFTYIACLKNLNKACILHRSIYQSNILNIYIIHIGLLNNLFILRLKMIKYI